MHETIINPANYAPKHEEVTSFEERRESNDTGYSSLENGECKVPEENGFSILIKDAVQGKVVIEEKPKSPDTKSVKKQRAPKAAGKKQPKKEEDEKPKEEENSSEEPRRSSRLKSKLENHIRMEDLLNSITLSDIEKFTENNRISLGENELAIKLEDTRTLETSSEPQVQLPPFLNILENEYCTERSISKDAERMICDCVLTREEILRGEKGCGEDCLNRLLLIECCSRCTLGDRCSNKRFQKREYAKCEVYKTEKKGFGLRLLEDVPSGTFLMEYVGEVLDADEFERRAMEYARDKVPHFYFMSLKSDYIIDATMRGNISRFINHSCEPNTETQKWTVQGELRVGFFSKRYIHAGEEITFDYQLQRYGKQAQRCYCEAPSCTGWIGEDPEKQADTEKRKEKKCKKKGEDAYVDCETALDEICQVGLINRHQTLNLNRLMVQVKEMPVRMQILQLIEEGHPSCRKLFVDYHGLPIICGWMVDCAADQVELKIQILNTLLSLPITNRTVLVDSKIWTQVEQWAFVVDQKTQSSEQLSAQSVLESVEDIASADETPVSELAQKLLNEWSSLREAFRIPKKERIQQMKEHEREADQNMVKPRPRRLPLYVENMRDRYYRNRHNRDKDFEKIYCDRWKDNDSKIPNNSYDPREGRGYDRKHFRKFDHKEGNDNKISKREHRYQFEMKVKQEEEYRRKWEEESQQQQQWLQQYQSQNMYYDSQRTPTMMTTTGQYMATVPPPNYTQESLYQNYYNTPPPNMYTNVMMPPPMMPAQTPTQPYYHSYPFASPLPYSQPQHQLPQQQPYTMKPTPSESVTSNSSSYSESSQHIGTPLEDIPIPTGESYQSSPAATTATEATTDNATEPTTEINPLNIDVTKLKLPPKWKMARDSEGRLYYYHKQTRVSQWYPPAFDETDVQEEEEVEIEITDDEDSSHEGSSEDEEMVIELRADILKLNREALEEKAEETDDEEEEINGNADYESEFFNNDDEQGSPVEESVCDERLSVSSPPSVAAIPLVTEHIISPRGEFDVEEHMRNKRKRRALREKLKKNKKRKSLFSDDDDAKCNGLLTSVSVAADTSGNVERKKKDSFRFHMANFIVSCLNPYFRSSCTQARITNNEDFKHLARKLTHFVMLKELKHCQNVTELSCNSSVKYKAKEYVRKYMAKFGEVYVRPADEKVTKYVSESNSQMINSKDFHTTPAMAVSPEHAYNDIWASTPLK